MDNLTDDVRRVLREALSDLAIRVIESRWIEPGREYRPLAVIMPDLEQVGRETRPV